MLDTISTVYIAPSTLHVPVCVLVGGDGEGGLEGLEGG
jgi:hypothetical protein